MSFMKHGVLALGLALTASAAVAQERFVFSTDWFAQAEHGGYYQALADGTYQRAGLDVTIRMGGPQVNTAQLLAAGQADCIIGYDTQVMKVREQGIPAVTVAAMFQKDPQVIIAHPTVQRIEELSDKTILVGSAGMNTYWPWLKATFGFTDSQVRPYTFNIQPFLADQNIAQQGYLSSEPFAIEQEGGFKPTVFLLSDLGWPPYSNNIVCMEKTLRERPQAVAAFVRASAEGWKNYLTGDPAAANALIKRDNPNMTDDKLANGIALLVSEGMVFSGDAATMGVGIITDERMQRTYNMMVERGLLDASKVDLASTYTTEFIRDVRVLP